MKLSSKERKGKWHLHCESGERGRDYVADVDHFLMLGIPSGQYLCFGGLSYLRVDQEKFYTRLFKHSIWSVLYKKRFGEDFSSNALNQKCF